MFEVMDMKAQVQVRLLHRAQEKRLPTLRVGHLKPVVYKAEKADILGLAVHDRSGG